MLTVDETGARVTQALHWIHAAGTDTLRNYAHHATRGLLAIKAIGVLIGFTGRRVRDAMAAYLGGLTSVFTGQPCVPGLQA